jgi:hypothetical protein
MKTKNKKKQFYELNFFISCYDLRMMKIQNVVYDMKYIHIQTTHSRSRLNDEKEKCLINL